jgi:hypothetical protein
MEMAYGLLGRWALEDSSRQQQVESLYKRASQIYIHEMTEDEWLFVRNLAYEDRSRISEAAFKRLLDLVERKGSLGPRQTGI